MTRYFTDIIHFNAYDKPPGITVYCINDEPPGFGAHLWNPPYTFHFSFYKACLTTPAGGPRHSSPAERHSCKGSAGPKGDNFCGDFSW